MFLNGCFDLLTLGKVDNLNLKSVAVNIKPLGNGLSRVSLYNSLDLIGSTGLFANGNNVACLKKVGSDVYAAAVYFKMSVAYELTGFCTRRSIACSVNYVVETALEDAEKVSTCNALLLNCHLKIMTELMLCNTVKTSCSLLCAELKSVFGRLLTSLAVLTGCVTSNGE